MRNTVFWVGIVTFSTFFTKASVVFAVLQLVIQALLLFVFVLVLDAGGAESPVAAMAMVLYPYANVLFSLSSSVCLLLTR